MSRKARPETLDPSAQLATFEGFARKLLTCRHVFDYGDGRYALVIEGEHGSGIRLDLTFDEWSVLWTLDPDEEARR